jgi:PmbA protein
MSISLDDGERRPEEYVEVAVASCAALPSVTGLADDALARVRGRVGAAKGPTRRCAMVVENRVAGALIQRLLRPATAEAVQQGQSLWSGRAGERVLSPRLTIVDDPTLAGGLASRPFDGEGIASRRLPIVEGGALANLYVDTYYGAKLGAAPTTGAPSNQIVAPGSGDLAALVSAAGDGVLVTSWLGGNLDPTSGAFSFGVRGHVIESGRVGGPIGEASVSGTIQELFAHLVDLGSDTWRYSSERCPSLLFEGVQFAGA